MDISLPTMVIDAMSLSHRYLFFVYKIHYSNDKMSLKLLFLLYCSAHFPACPIHALHQSSVSERAVALYVMLLQAAPPTQLFVLTGSLNGYT